MRIQTILLPVDGSEYSTLACRYAAEMAVKTSAKVIIVHCYGDLNTRLSQSGMEDVMEDVIHESKEILAGYEDMLRKAGVQFESRSVKGVAGEQITWVAEQAKADMIIMGSKGHSNLAGLVIGSVTNDVLQSAPCPVMVVR